MQTECIVIDKHIDRLGFTCGAVLDQGGLYPHQQQPHPTPLHQASSSGVGDLGCDGEGTVPPVCVLPPSLLGQCPSTPTHW